jgi:hypothetical protein
MRSPHTPTIPAKKTTLDRRRETDRAHCRPLSSYYPNQPHRAATMGDAGAIEVFPIQAACEPGASLKTRRRRAGEDAVR